MFWKSVLISRRSSNQSTNLEEMGHPSSSSSVLLAVSCCCWCVCVFVGNKSGHFICKKRVPHDEQKISLQKVKSFGQLSSTPIGKKVQHSLLGPGNHESRLEDFGITPHTSTALSTSRLTSTPPQLSLLSTRIR